MAITADVILSSTTGSANAGTYSYIADISASADTDTTANIPHNLGATPLSLKICPLSSAGRLSDWIMSADSTNCVIAKTTTASSGATTSQVRIEASLPWSATR